MAIEWNFLNPYMRPISENLMLGAQQGLAQQRFNRGLAEEKRQFEAQKPYRQAMVQQLQNHIAQQNAARAAYNWASGGSGQMFQQPYTQERANQVLLNPFMTNYLGIPAAQAPKSEAMVNIPNYGQLPASVGYHYLPKEKEPPKPNEQWGPIQYDKYGHAYVVNKSTNEVKSLWGGPGEGGNGKGGKGDYTLQQMIDDNLAHYNNEFTQRTAYMTDPVTGIPYKEYRDQYQAIQQEIYQKFIQDNYRINQMQRPAWLTGADNPEQIQTRYNQLRQQGLTPDQIADKLRQEGYPIE